MTLHRFFLPLDAFAGNEIAFPPETAHQIRRVLRLQTGDPVITLDNTGMEFVTTLRVDHDHVLGVIQQRRQNAAEPPAQLTLYIGLLKAAKLELILQKCTEIGVSRFVPIHTARSVAGEPGTARQHRFETIVREAAEQSGRGRIPEVSRTLPYEEAMREAVQAGPLIVLWEEEKSHKISETVLQADSGQIGLIVGPEGGLTEGEVALAKDVGAQVTTLGPRILRAETAAIVGTTLAIERFSSGKVG